MSSSLDKGVICSLVSIGELEPQQVPRNAEQRGPVRQTVEILDRRTVFDPAQLCLSDAYPASDSLLGYWPDMMRMQAIRRDHPSHMPAFEGIAHPVCRPEAGRHL